MIGLGLVFSGSTVAWTAAMQSQSASATTLPPNSLPLHNNTAGAADGCPSDGAYWHFVLTPNNSGSSFASIVLNVGGDTFTFSGFPPIIANGSQTDNAFVPVPSGRVVTDLETSGSYATYSGGPPSQFVLSGVCVDGGETTTTDAPTTSSTDPTTTAPTTTTAAPTTTTDAPTTTTAAPTTTTAEAPTTSTACDSENCSTTTSSLLVTTGRPAGCTGPACDPQSTTTALPTTDPPTTVTVSPALVQADAAAPLSSGSTLLPAQLASTGANTVPLAFIAAGLIGLGIGALALGSRRRGSPSQQ